MYESRLCRFCKSSFIITIFKADDRAATSGITKLSEIPKFFEMLVCDKITPQVNGTVDNTLHEFVSRKSMETKMVCFIYYFLVESLYILTSK